MLPDFLISCLNKIAEKEGIKDYKIETDAGCGAGENFMGVMIAATLSGTKDGKPTELHLLCKTPPPNFMRQKNFNSELAFGREVDIYLKVFPAFERFQREKGLSGADLFAAYPRVFACDREQVNQTIFLVSFFFQFSYQSFKFFG